MGRKREKRRRETLMYERNIDWLPLTRPQLRTWPATRAGILTGNQTGDLLVLRLALNPPSHTTHGYTFSLCLALY